MSENARPPHHYALILRAARNLLGIRQTELAILSGVSPPAIARIEKGRNVPRSSTWRVLLWTLKEYDIVVEEGQGDDVVVRFNTMRLSILEDEGLLKRDIDERSGTGRSE
jgi:predicted transcriptional regulator